MPPAIILITIWTCVCTILMILDGIINAAYPPSFNRWVTSDTMKSLIYITTLVCAALTLWENWKIAYGGGSFG